MYRRNYMQLCKAIVSELSDHIFGSTPQESVSHQGVPLRSGRRSTNSPLGGGTSEEGGGYPLKKSAATFGGGVRYELPDHQWMGKG